MLLDVRGLKGDDAVQVEPCLELDAREVAFGIRRNALGAEPRDPRVDAAG